MDIPPSDTGSETRKEESGIGPMAAIIIIVGLLLAGGIYFLVSSEMERRAAPAENQARL
ncbi:MAG TPA: hypothetical protein VHD37_02530 [Candidatus Paceibacterota bacterium]|nr:hypothetical protein [Candidatus Paceibacterota bacterium]